MSVPSPASGSVGSKVPPVEGEVGFAIKVAVLDIVSDAVTVVAGGVDGFNASSFCLC